MKMLCRFIICLIFKLFLVVCVPGHKLVQPGPPEFCLKTKSFHINDEYHKEVPSPEESDLPVCQSWKEYSCCTRALTDTLSHSKTQGLYNFSRELCDRPLSPVCAEYFRNDDCFYWCEPMLRYFQTSAGGNIQNVPICMEYCDAWFEACKDDLTCFENWLEEYVPLFGITTCPDPYSCRKFHEVYGDGKRLCNRIWGNHYVYSTDMDNCTVMVFNGSMPNPNFKLTFPSDGGLSKLILGSTQMCTSALLIFVLIAADIF